MEDALSEPVLELVTEAEELTDMDTLGVAVREPDEVAADDGELDEAAVPEAEADTDAVADGLDPVEVDGVGVAAMEGIMGAKVMPRK